MKKILTLLFLFIAMIANAAKYYKSKIEFIDGSTKEGYAELPSNRLLDNAIKYRATKEGERVKFDFDDIKNITYYTDEGNQYTFEWSRTRISVKSFGKVREKIYKKKHWLLIRFQDPLIKYYYVGQTYQIDKNGNLVTKVVDRSGTWANLGLLFKRPGEEAPTILGYISYGAVIIGEEKKFRKWAMLYFDGETALTERIKNKEFKIEDMLDLAKAYIAHKNGQNSKE